MKETACYCESVLYNHKARFLYPSPLQNKRDEHLLKRRNVPNEYFCEDSDVDGDIRSVCFLHTSGTRTSAVKKTTYQLELNLLMLSVLSGLICFADLHPHCLFLLSFLVWGFASLCCLSSFSLVASVQNTVYCV